MWDRSRYEDMDLPRSGLTRCGLLGQVGGQSTVGARGGKLQCRQSPERRVEWTPSTRGRRDSFRKMDSVKGKENEGCFLGFPRKGGGKGGMLHKKKGTHTKRTQKEKKTANNEIDAGSRWGEKHTPNWRNERKEGFGPGE